MGFLPKDYVGVSSRIEKAHEQHKENISIETSFDIMDKTVIFTAKVSIKESGQVFTGHSFGEVGKDKSFEKLETVAVGRALAFAGFETRDGIASREEMEVFETRKVEKPDGTSYEVNDDDKTWFNEENWNKFMSLKHEETEPTDLVKKARRHYLVSRQWAYKIEHYYRTGEDNPLDSFPKK